MYYFIFSKATIFEIFEVFEHKILIFVCETEEPQLKIKRATCSSLRVVGRRPLT